MGRHSICKVSLIVILHSRFSSEQTFENFWEVLPFKKYTKVSCTFIVLCKFRSGWLLKVVQGADGVAWLSRKISKVSSIVILHSIFRWSWLLRIFGRCGWRAFSKHSQKSALQSIYLWSFIEADLENFWKVRMACLWKKKKRIATSRWFEMTHTWHIYGSFF